MAVIDRTGSIARVEALIELIPSANRADAQKPLGSDDAASPERGKAEHRKNIRPHGGNGNSQPHNDQGEPERSWPSCPVAPVPEVRDPRARGDRAKHHRSGVMVSEKCRLDRAPHKLERNHNPK